MERNVDNAALNLQATAGPDPLSDAEYDGDLRPEHRRGDPAGARPAAQLHVRAGSRLRRRQEDRLQRHAHAGHAARRSPSTRSWRPGDHGAAAGRRRSLGAGLPSGYEQHKGIDEYYKRLGPTRRSSSLVEEVADNQANAHEALKFGNNSHLNSSLRTSRPAARTRSTTAPRCRSARPLSGKSRWTT